MPNWCTNRLSITGPKEMLSSFINKASHLTEDNPLSLENLYPTPRSEDTIKDQAEDCFLLKSMRTTTERNTDWGRDGWYYWRVHNWGTKWDSDGAKVIASDNQAVYDFQTAWSPPIEAFLKVSKDFPDLEFTLDYWESGCCFAGTTCLQDGESTRIVELDNITREVFLDDKGGYQNPGLSEEFFGEIVAWYEEIDEFEASPL